MRIIAGFAVPCLVLLAILLSVAGCSVKPEDYTSPTLEIRKISDDVLKHTSFLESTQHGKVPCNGLIIIEDNRAIVIDTPTTIDAAWELITVLTEQYGLSLELVVPTQSRLDCLGGLKAFHESGIPSAAYRLTINLARFSGRLPPQRPFGKEHQVKIGEREILFFFPGHGYVRDNVVAYDPKSAILFGGCLVKALGDDQGDLSDADVEAWPDTIRRVQDRFPEADTVVPGHGAFGGTDLLDYTIELFTNLEG